jgi:hypothetical protein
MRRCRTEKRRSPYGHGPKGSEIKRPSVWPSTTFHCIMNRRTVDAIGGIDVSTQPTDLPVVPICRGPRLLISTPNQWLHSNRPTPQRGVSRSSRTRGGMRWTRQRLAREGIAGRVERLVSDQRAGGREMLLRTAKSCGPDAPTLASSSRSCVGPTGLRQNISADNGGKRARSPGRARHKPLKPLRAGMPGDSGVLVVTRVRSTNTKCTRGRGCSGHPAFPTPSKGARDKCKPRAHRAARSLTHIWN